MILEHTHTETDTHWDWKTGIKEVKLQVMSTSSGSGITIRPLFRHKHTLEVLGGQIHQNLSHMSWPGLILHPRVIIILQSISSVTPNLDLRTSAATIYRLIVNYFDGKLIRTASWIWLFSRLFPPVCIYLGCWQNKTQVLFSGYNLIDW